MIDNKDSCFLFSILSERICALCIFDFEKRQFRGSIEIRQCSLKREGLPASGKIMKTWKMDNTFSKPGKIMEFEKNSRNHGI